MNYTKIDIFLGLPFGVPNGVPRDVPWDVPMRIPQSVRLHSHWGVRWDVSGKSFGLRVHKGFLWGNGKCTQSQNESTS